MLTDQSTPFNDDYKVTDSQLLKYRNRNQGDARLGTILYKNSRGQYSFDKLKITDGVFLTLRGTTALVSNVDAPNYSYEFANGSSDRSLKTEVGYYTINGIVEKAELWGSLTGNGSSAKGTLKGRCIATCANYISDSAKSYNKNVIKMYVDESGQTVITNTYNTYKSFNGGGKADNYNIGLTSTVKSSNYIFYVVICAAGGGGYSAKNNDPAGIFGGTGGGCGEGGAAGVFRVDLTNTNASNPVIITLGGPG